MQLAPGLSVEPQVEVLVSMVKSGALGPAMAKLEMASAAEPPLLTVTGSSCWKSTVTPEKFSGDGLSVMLDGSVKLTARLGGTTLSVGWNGAAGWARLKSGVVLRVGLLAML